MFPFADARAAEPATPDQEIIVYGDDFARWDHTRWLLQSEIVLPLGMVFSSDENKAFRSFGFQIRAVIGCEKDIRLSKKKWEVSCTVEDFGLLATSEDRWRKEKDRSDVEAVLTEVDARLTGARVQMQVDEEGGITNFDMEGIDSSNLRERKIQETTRQMMSRVMAGFHLRIPEHAQQSGTWVEYRSELMDLPSLTSSRGTSTIVNLVSPYQGLQVVQTKGEGVVLVSLPNTGGDPFSNPPPEIEGGGSSGPSGGIGAVGMATPLTITASSGRIASEGESGIDASFAMSLEGVGLFEKETGILTERVWTCVGIPTAGSARNVGAYRNLGRIQMLGSADKPDVGPTGQVAWPNAEMEGLPPWISIEAMPSSGPG